MSKPWEKYNASTEEAVKPWERRSKTQTPLMDNPLRKEGGGYTLGGEFEHKPNPFDYARSAVQGSSLGYLDEMEGAARSALGGDSYEEERDRSAKRMQRFSETAPGTDLALNIAGGVLSPVSKLSMLKAPATAGKIAKIATPLIAAGTEGAVAGAGYANPDERAEGALLGAGLGGGTSALTQTLGKLGRTAINKRIKTKLDRPDGTFKPITVAGKEEGNRGILMRAMENVVRNLPASPLRKTEREYVAGVLPGVQQKLADVVEETVDRNVAGKQLVKARKRKIGKAAESRKRGIESKVDEANRVLDSSTKQGIKQTDEMIEADRKIMRREAMESSVAPHMDFTFDTKKGTAENVKALKDSVTRGYKDAWSGFDFGASDIKPVSKEVVASFNDDGRRTLDLVNKEIKLAAKNPSDNRGYQLDKTLRNKIKELSEKNPDAAKIVSELRVGLRKGIGDSEPLEQMDAIYPKYLSVRDARFAAKIEAGDFTPQQLATSSGSVAGKQRFDKIPHEDIFVPIHAKEKGLKQTVDRAKENLGELKDKNQQKRKLLIQATSDKKDELLHRTPDHKTIKTQEVFDGYNAAKDKEKYLRELENLDPSLYYNLLAMGTVGGLGAGMSSIPGSLTGLGIGYGAGTKVGQRLLAGQTKGQKVARDFVRKNPELGGQLSGALRRGAIYPQIEEEY